MSGFPSKTVPALFIAVGIAYFAYPALSADLALPVRGELIGSVVDAQGVPQMGATVQLFDRLDHLVSKTTSTVDGKFSFAHLPADTYSVRVSLADFLTATRDHILVKPGVDSMLQIHLATLLSSVELTYTLPTGAMSKDWRYVLRSSPATRPITRLREETSSSNAEANPRVFSGTHAVVSVAGGDFNLMDADQRTTDVGTGFALSTNFLDKNQIRVGGSVAQNSGLAPAAMGLVAVYTRKDDGLGYSAPEVTVSLAQINVGPGSGAGPIGSGLAGMAFLPLRTISTNLYQAINVGDAIRVEYGATAEAVDAWVRGTRISPFARLTGSLGSAGAVIASYSAGASPDALRTHKAEDRSDDSVGPQDNPPGIGSIMSAVPQASYANGRLELQGTRTYEIGYQKQESNRTYTVSAFLDDVSNGRVDVSGDTSVLNSGDLMSDGISPTSIYNIGNFQRRGFLASVDQKLNDSVDFGFAYGRMGGLTTSDKISWTASGSLSGFLEESSHNTATFTASCKAPKLGTKLTAGYGWMDSKAVIPQHVFTTQNTYIWPGLNVLIRQPLPSLFGMPGHLEISADLRNLLAQGYLPVDAAAGRTLLLVQSPRAIRGGLNFIF